MGSLRFAPSALATLLLAALTLPSPTLTFHLAWGPDLEGPWCATRPRGNDCCDGRDDYCSVPILGTECYCDIFCNDTAYDCCPDFWAHCHGAPTPAPTTTTTTLRTTPAEIRRQCVLGGKFYRPGDRVVDNCKQCTCELYVSGGSRRYDMLCSEDACLIRPELIQAVNTGRYTWRAANYSFFWGKTLQDGIRYRLGTYPLEPKVVSMTPIKVRQDEALPESFDARVKWPMWLQPIRDQGDCGASWAFSTTAVASDRLSIESEGAIVGELSAQHMLNCDTDGQDGCSGGWADRAWVFLRRYGVVTEACYPYVSGKTRIEDMCQLPVTQRGGNCPSGIQYKIDKRYKASPPYRIRPLEREIMKEIMDNGPVQAIFEVPEDFFMYKSGVYQYTSLTHNDPPSARKSGYHSVRLIGWGVERTFDGDIVRYWIGANSWGPEWGENGYFRIIRGINANYIENYIVGAWGQVSGDKDISRLLAESRRRRLLARGETQGGGNRGLRQLRNLIGRRQQKQKKREEAKDFIDKRLRSLDIMQGEGKKRGNKDRQKENDLSVLEKASKKQRKRVNNGSYEDRKEKKKKKTGKKQSLAAHTKNNVVSLTTTPSLRSGALEEFVHS